MKKIRAFRLKRRLVQVFNCILLRRKAKIPILQRLNFKPISKILSLARSLHRGASKRLGFVSNSDPGYIRLGQEEEEEEEEVVEVPKGHLAVYVEESGGDTRRVVVPVIYFNHPLFGELLKEAERVYGYDYPGGITLRCGFSEFEKVKTRIAAWDDCRRRRRWGSCSISSSTRSRSRIISSNLMHEKQYW